MLIWGADGDGECSMTRGAAYGELLSVFAIITKKIISLTVNITYRC
jgi:hypothetical protein